jgi:hypothetical protein
MKALYAASSLVLLVAIGRLPSFEPEPDPLIIQAHLPEGYPDPDGKIEAWLRRQKNMNGGSCCDPDDHVAILDNEQWKIDGDHYSAKVNGDWIEIPNSALLLRWRSDPNPTGKAVLWSGFNTMMPHNVDPYCFSPGTGT